MLSRLKPALVGACLSLCGTPQASSADWYTGSESPQNRNDWIVAADASISGTSQSSLYGKVAVTGAVSGSLAQTGARLRIEGLAGGYSYDSRQLGRVNGSQVEGAALVGYEYVWRDASLAGYVGVNVRSNELSVPDPGNPVVGASVGVKGVLEFYAKPTDTTMVSGYGSYVTSFNAYYARLRWGVALAGTQVHVGPEVGVLGDDFFGQYRIGAHIGGMRLGSVELGLAGGYAYDRVQKGGFYSTLDARTTF